MMYNDTTTIGVVKPQKNDDFYFCNGDGDDLFYIHQGGGTLLSWFGEIAFTQGDFCGGTARHTPSFQTGSGSKPALVLGGKYNLSTTARTLPQPHGATSNGCALHPS